MTEWSNRDDRQADAKAQYEHIMTTPAPPAIGAYIDAGVIGFVFGEMWRRGVLTPRDRRWVTLACVGAADAPIPMETHTYAALNSGDVTNEEIDEFLLFFGTQMGWPKGSAMNTHILTAMAKIAEERGEEMQLPAFVPWTDPVDDDVRRVRGEAAYTEVHGVAPPPATTAFRGRAYLDFLYGEVWTRDEYLTRRDRRLVSICCSAELGVETETTEHLEAALRNGELTYEELQEVVMHVAVYLGWITRSPPRRPARGRRHPHRGHSRLTPSPSSPVDRCSAGRVALDRLPAVFTSETWVNACGKLPRRRPDAGSYSSDSRPTSLRSAMRRSNRVRASSERPSSARLSASQNEQGRNTPSPGGRPSTPSSDW